MTKVKDMGTADVQTAVSAIVKAARDHNILIGPAVWRESDGTSAKRWYVIVAVGDQRARMHVMQIVLNDPLERDALVFGIISHRGIVVQDFDDELRMAQMADAIWPSERSKKIVSGIKRERGLP